VKSHLKIQEEEEEEEQQQRIAASNFISWLLQEHYPFTSTRHFVPRLMIRT
jgi:hypothetical protein